jgi:hypothetical protein
MSPRRAALHRPDSPIRPARATRKSASGPGGRVANSRDVGIYFREDCRPLDDSLQLEMVVAQYLLQIRDVRTTAGLPIGEVVGAGVVAELEGHRDELSHAILRGIAHVAPGRMGERAADAAAHLAGREIGLPAKFEDVGLAKAVGAWRATEGAHPGEYVLFAEFEHPAGRRHTIAVFVEPRRGGRVKHLGLMDAMSAIAPDGPFDPARMESLDLATAGGLLRDVVDRTYGPSLAETDDFRVLIAAARARSMS